MFRFENFELDEERLGELEDLDYALYAWDWAVDNWHRAAQDYNKMKAAHEVKWNAKKIARINSGMSVSKAEIDVTKDPLWEEEYINITNAGVYLQEKKEKIGIARAAFEAVRTDQVSKRAVR